MKTTQKADKWQIIERYTREQIFVNNAKCDAWNAKNSEEIKAKHQKIQILQNQIEELKTKINELRDARSPMSNIVMGSSLYAPKYVHLEKQQKEFFASVVEFARLAKFEPKIETEHVYKLKNGKWYTQSLHIPTDENGNMDETKTYFEKVEVLI